MLCEPVTEYKEYCHAENVEEVRPVAGVQLRVHTPAQPVVKPKRIHLFIIYILGDQEVTANLYC